MRRRWLVMAAILLAGCGSGGGSTGDSGGATDGGGEDAAGADGAVGEDAAGEDGAGGDTTSAAGVVVNELFVFDPDGGPDWIELYNGGGAAADLTGWGITDDQDDLARTWRFPDGTTLAPGAFLVVEGEGSTAPLVLPFAFGRGEQVALLDAQDTFVDALDWIEGDIPDGATFGRIPDGTGPFQVLWTPTPGAANEAP